MLPELLTRIEPQNAARYVLDSGFWLQQKRDGVRLLVRRQGQQIEGWNKMGQPTAVDPTLACALLSLNLEAFVLDGEFEKRTGYHCWDLLGAADTDLTEYPYATRFRLLDAFAACSTIKIVPSWTTPAEKEAMLFEFHRQRAEGVVFKNSEAKYRPGRAGQHFKLKFAATCTVRVREVDPTRDRVSVEMLDAGLWREVCGVKVPNGTLKEGQYIEIRYLYGTAEKHLVQPCFLAVRDDVCDADCTWTQVRVGSKWQL